MMGSSEPKIPVVVAVGFWVASALAVLSYTYVAYRETATGAAENFAVSGGTDPGLVALGSVLNAELKPQKPLERGKFKPSR